MLDQTAQFTQSGTVEILTPADIAPLAKFDLRELYWIRATLTFAGPNGSATRSLCDDPIATPRLSAIYLNTIAAVQAVTVTNEIVGSGNGLPGQSFRLSQSPVLGGPEILVLEPELPSAVERDELPNEGADDAVQQTINPATGEAEIWIRWHEVTSFHGSGPHSRHYTLDHGTGELVFGNGASGLLPPLGTNSIVANYRVGAGSAGNVLEGAVAQLKSPVPGIVSVSNRLRADGGADLETAETVRRRGPQTLRHRGRALSRTDFEWMALEAAGTRLARVVCLPNTNRDLAFEPGWVTLVIVPHGTERRLIPGVELIRLVEESVGSRAFAGLENLRKINVVGPGYIEVSVDAEIAVGDLRRASQVKRDVTDALDRFLHPLTGGPEGEGWELGRNVFASEIASVIQTVPGVDYLRDLRLIPGQAQSRIEIPPTVFSRDLPESSLIVSTEEGAPGEGGQPDVRKSALLAERILAGTETKWLRIRGFKAEDRVIRGLDPSLRGTTFNLPLTITSVSGDNELTIGVDTHDVDPPEKGTLLTTPDERVKLPISALRNEGSSSCFLGLDDFSSSDSVQILLPDRSELPGVPLLNVKQVLPASEIVYLGGIFLVCSG
ncbi:MAG TPA: putative baseplate assembly protein, partial [Terrimicrobiaceae bacterium]|nr:putative baseplate assembly protein [Terrimicrobiaceae bacterium]